MQGNERVLNEHPWRNIRALSWVSRSSVARANSFFPPDLLGLVVALDVQPRKPLMKPR